MLPVIIGLIGAIIGAVIAKRRQGKPLDIAQYAGAYFIAFAIVGLVLNILLLRMI